MFIWSDGFEFPEKSSVFVCNGKIDVRFGPMEIQFTEKEFLSLMDTLCEVKKNIEEGMYSNVN